MAVDLVVFDIGNVLLNWDPEGYYDRAMGRVARVRLFQEVPLNEMNLSIDAGAPWHQTVEETAEKYRRWKPEILAWRDNWGKMASPLIDESVAMLRALRAKRIPVWSLTNFGRETFDYACSVYPALTEFDGAVVSAHIGIVKPDPGIYEALERETGIAPGRILFTDDKRENIAAAAARGWQVHHFDGPRGWADRLVAEGLLSPSEARAA
ncbi:HAD family hydrolase [Palleronia abyssalis]|uniref:Alpha-D-glucose 1-phosphate phosphatase YihX n=1 Tax=Palleronia abyssalis TaxID=1501240 RepID=A0A2R8BT21_9RHOB|nr:HAD family phosphatase [Palleronia abyssalis]SPJ23312.1 Alpha-D-glucose 1-phosphate phosphatase YihX [Palleronia abyssalis]